MDERDFFLEARTRKPAMLQCPFCRSNGEYALEWMVRKKRTNINLDRLDERDRARFEKAASYMVLLDDMVTCGQQSCRRRFEISGVKTMAFVTPEQLEGVNFNRDDRPRGTQPRVGQSRDARQGQDRPRADRGRDRATHPEGRAQPQGHARSQDPARHSKKGKVRPNRDEDFGNRIDDPELPSHMTYREPGSVHPGSGFQPQGGRPGGRQYGQGQQGFPPKRSGKSPGSNPPGGPRKGPPQGPRTQPPRHEEGQPLRSPRGKRSDPTGPGGGWR
jgi:hypothetical protein